MNLHANSRTCPCSRLLLCRRVVEQGWEAGGGLGRLPVVVSGRPRNGLPVTGTVIGSCLIGLLGLIAVLRGWPSSVCRRSRR
jgi:hypothetical protein